jgi:hypothetical protein
MPLTSLLGDVPIGNATVGMLAEALAKVLQNSQTMSPWGPRSGRKKPKLPVESFTDTQRLDNKVCDYLKQMILLTETMSGKCLRIVQNCIPRHKRRRVYASCAGVSRSHIVFHTWNGHRS